MRIKKVFFGLILIIFCFSCSTVEKKSNSNLTYGNVKNNIIKGETTQSDILGMFGSPNIITKNKTDNEVWNYSRMSYDSSENSSGLWLILAGKNSNAVSNSSSSFDLIIIFNNDDTVKDYSVISSKF